MWFIVVDPDDAEQGIPRVRRRFLGFMSVLGCGRDHRGFTALGLISRTVPDLENEVIPCPHRPVQ